ncbi:ABC transporter permease [Methylopila turkensis]|uniref:Taurine ABC transporter permease n=1 Tax=Methylopila turkensis TaxID=1437816 RepID=A0A9W6JTT0_9HYPH|nr:ABC transporter permease [Methylopila turkensis]GLK81679.1 taurine ABC transporter permease [Methylopila turkensis]
MTRSEARRARLRYVLVATLSPLAILALWALVAWRGLASPIILPPPSAIWTSFLDMAANGYSGVPLWTHVAASLARVSVAYVAGAALGVALGLLRGRSALIDAVLLAPSELLRPIPPLGLIPLFILWFGVGETSKVLLIFLSVLLIMMVNAQAGVRAASLDSLRAAQSMGANRWQVFRFVVLPSALPQIMTGLRVAMGTALTILVASELLGGDRGLGFLILDASSFFRTTYVFAGVALIGLIGLATDRGLAWAGRRIVHWEGRR